MRRMLALALIAGIATVTGSVSWAQPRGVTLHQGRCVKAEVPGVLILPDASRCNAAEVRICFVRWVSPAVAMHLLYVDDRPWGTLLGRVGRDDNVGGDQPLVVYSRYEGGLVRLAGLAWPHEHGMLTIRFGVPGSRADPSRLLAELPRGSVETASSD